MDIEIDIDFDIDIDIDIDSIYICRIGKLLPHSSSRERFC